MGFHMLWKHGNVALRIWPLDHCPPHVTAVCRADTWTARFQFSMVTEAVSLWDIKPTRNAPKVQVDWGRSTTLEWLKEA